MSERSCVAVLQGERGSVLRTSFYFPGGSVEQVRDDIIGTLQQDGFVPATPKSAAAWEESLIKKVTVKRAENGGYVRCYAYPLPATLVLFPRGGGVVAFLQVGAPWSSAKGDFDEFKALHGRFAEGTMVEDILMACGLPELRAGQAAGGAPALDYSCTVWLETDSAQSYGRSHRIEYLLADGRVQRKSESESSRHVTGSQPSPLARFYEPRHVAAAILLVLAVLVPASVAIWRRRRTSGGEVDSRELRAPGSDHDNLLGCWGIAIIYPLFRGLTRDPGPRKLAVRPRRAGRL
jgi:hypothetical protein